MNPPHIEQMSTSINAESMNMTLFVKRVFVDLIKNLEITYISDYLGRL